MRNRKRVAALAVSAAGLVGCSNQQPLEQTDMAMAWNQKLAPYGLVTIFPPRTNVEPGDLYIMCDDPPKLTTPSKRFPPIFVTPLEGFHDQIANFFRQRWVLPPEKSNSTGSDIDIPETATGITTPTKWTRLALASFPEIFQVEGTTTSAGLSAPTGFSIFGLGGQRKKLETYVLSMPAAEWAGLPWFQAQDQANVALDKLGLDKRQRIITFYQNMSNTYQTACGKVRFAIVQEVYYTRHMTLSFGTDKSAAINAQARLYVNPNQARYNVLQAASQTAVASPPAIASGASDANVNQANKDMTNAQNAANAAVNLGLPGAMLTSASVANDGLSFDYHFASPVAVGAKLLDVLVDGTKIVVDIKSAPIAYATLPMSNVTPAQFPLPATPQASPGGTPQGQGTQQPHQ